MPQAPDWSASASTATAPGARSTATAYLFGDAGSAFAIGRAGLAAVQRARDGRGPATTLAGTHLDPISLYPSPTLVADVAAFTPDVFRHAPTDEVAQAIVDQAARDIADTIHAALPGTTTYQSPWSAASSRAPATNSWTPCAQALSPRANSPHRQARP